MREKLPVREEKSPDLHKTTTWWVVGGGSVYKSGLNRQGTTKQEPAVSSDTPRGPEHVVVVGEVNPYGSDPKFALYHLPRKASGDRLRDIMGLDDVTYAKLRKVNLCTGSWDPRGALAIAADLVDELHRGDVSAVLLGAKVGNIFRRAGLVIPDPFGFRLAGGARGCARLPHPSGMCRAWNNPESTRRAREVLARIAPWVAWGSSS